ncbi:Thiol-disulfide oxidoreductase ResA [Dyadobacter sp. CECT 9275]|uniref:Thiol-disulfide oxidoreductase ResA n=1 Tax=Dyadobacter helix TaxID=2822344 RepID=A0A916JGB2_9BACT|nr:TlpA disulfide reductase family protein [Dyadobacter sp. CECT 9275]CAG5012007.1 Thiol-disulfide oxidoreductase ResA [Dyadobacter sp. CECT 9275]
MRYIVLFFILLFPKHGSLAKPVIPDVVKEGVWRATLLRDGQALPFILEIRKNTDGKTFSVFAVNGSERLRMDTAFVAQDSIHIPMQLFDSEIVAHIEPGSLKGKYNRLSGKNVIAWLPFEAKFGDNYKFYKQGEARSPVNITGKWSAVFHNPATGGNTPSVANFTQKGSDVTGSFLTPTGDYRFLTGSMNGDSLYLSTFDGSNAMLFKASVQADGTLKGVLWTGVAGYRTWTAKADPDAKLPDATKLTFLKPGAGEVNFSFTDSKGQTVSLSDAAFKNKVVILQIMGSWCPNCMDETNFLVPWYKKNKKRGVEIIGLAFEKSDNPDISNPKIKRMITRFGIEYPVLLAGTNTDAGTAKALPMLNKVMSYPTTIFIDKKGKVREIHTGFSGPGTGKYYDQFVEEFTRLTDKLLSE